jgi:Ca2+-binding EF-hand superfamily protein
LPDWNARAAFTQIDSQRQDFISHFNLYGFLNSHAFDATDQDLIGIIRRIEGSGNSKVDYDEFKHAFQPFCVKICDITFAEDEKDKMIARRVDDIDKTRPYLGKLAATKPINGQNNVDVNL